jgi:hypothetical protein
MKAACHRFHKIALKKIASTLESEGIDWTLAF